MLRPILRIPSSRSVKHITGFSEKGNRGALHNYKAGVGKLTQVRQHDDHFKRAKKSSTLAYPEEAIIDASSQSAVST